MASGAERLKEFVVGLGFEIDEQQFRNFSKVLDKVVENIAEIGAATAIVAAVIDKNVTVIAARFEKLYYASQRSGASVKNLQGLEYGAQQIGFQAGAATSAIEGMTAAMRSQPGLSALFRNMSGGATDPTKQFVNIIDALKNMEAHSSNPEVGHAVAARFAALLGISEPDFKMYEQGNEKLKALMAERDAQFAAAGVNPDEVAKRSVDFQNDIRRLSATVEIIETLVLTRFMPTIDKLVAGLQAVASFVARADKATGGASTYGIAGLGVAGAFGGLKLLPKLVRGLLGLGGAGAAEGAAVGVGEGAAAGAGGAGAAAVAAELLPVVLIVLGALGLSWLIKHTGAADVGGSYSAHSQVNQFRKWIGLDTGGGSGDNFTKKFEGWRNKVYGDLGQKGTIGFGHLVKAGEHFGLLSKEEGEALFQKDMTEAKGAVAAMTRGHALTAGQMAALADFQYNTGKLGNSMLLRLVNSGRMKEAAKAFELYDGYHDKAGVYHHSDSLMKRRLGEESMFSGGGGNSAVHAQTTIHVTVDKNPRQNAQAIGDEQARVNSDLLRNMRPKVN